MDLVRHQVLDLVRARGAVAQICVLREGRVVLDQAFGCRPDTPFLIFSAGKPFVAILTHLLAERGRLALDDPVAKHWPEFARHGKDAITIRQVLQHRSGVPVARGIRRDALIAADWNRSVRALENARPAWPPGQVPAYHIISYGFILGEIVQRVTGTPLREVMRAEFFDPLGLTDTHLGTPAALWPQRVPLRAYGLGGRVRQVVFNQRTFREAVIPAATISCTARDLARFYQMLVDGGELDGVRVFRPDTIAEARLPSCEGDVDRLLRLPIRWSHGFQLGGPADRPQALGRDSGPDTFGHNGSNCCVAWADPERRLVVAYLTNRLVFGLDGSAHQCAVSDAVLAAYP